MAKTLHLKFNVCSLIYYVCMYVNISSRFGFYFLNILFCLFYFPYIKKHYTICLKYTFVICMLKNVNQKKSTKII